MSLNPNTIYQKILFLNENICCGYLLEVPGGGASNEYPQHTFLLRNKKNIISCFFFLGGGGGGEVCGVFVIFFFFFFEGKKQTKIKTKNCLIWSYDCFIIVSQSYLSNLGKVFQFQDWIFRFQDCLLVTTILTPAFNTLEHTYKDSHKNLYWVSSTNEVFSL